MMGAVLRSISDLLEQSAKALGETALPDGTRLIGRVPHVGSEAWLHVVFRALEPAEISGLEAQVGRSLPSDYRAFLGEANGLSLFSDELSFYGLRTSYDRTGSGAIQPYSLVTPNVKERPKTLPTDAIVVATYRWDGSRVYMRTSKPGPLIRCERGGGPSLNEWPTLGQMISDEAHRLATLFDGHGKRISTPTVPTPTPA